MALNRLSTSDMVNLGGDLVKRGTPERRAIEAVPMAAALLPSLEAAHRGLLEAQPPSQSAIEKLTNELAEEDRLHDELIRGIDSRLVSEIALAREAMARDSFIAARGTLFSNGLQAINFSYGQQAGEAKLRAARMSPETERTLRRLKTADGTNLFEQVEHLQAAAVRIGMKEKERSEIGAMTMSAPKALAARHQWVRAIRALEAVFELAGVDAADALGRIRAAEAKADAKAPQVPPAEEPVEDPLDAA